MIDLMPELEDAASSQVTLAMAAEELGKDALWLAGGGKALHSPPPNRKLRRRNSWRRTPGPEQMTTASRAAGHHAGDVREHRRQADAVGDAGGDQPCDPGLVEGDDRRGPVGTVLATAAPSAAPPGPPAPSPGESPRRLLILGDHDGRAQLHDRPLLRTARATAVAVVPLL
jgi:hypothetical protein